MTKKQFGIIFTLMALIVCVGVIAARINKTGLNDPTDFSQVIAGQDTEEDKDKDKETLGSQDYFFTLRSEKEKEDAITLLENTLFRSSVFSRRKNRSGCKK